MELILVRHAEPVAHVVAAGNADPGLTPVGVAQAQALADSPALGHVDLIVQSPARRAMETARPIAEQRGLNPVTVDALVEWDWGSADYIPVEAMRAANDPRWQRMVRGEPYDGVDVPAFRRRVLTAIGDVVAANPGRRRVLVVCHAGVINAYTGDVVGTDMLLWFHPAYTSFCRVAAARDGRRGILSINETPHLLGVELATAAVAGRKYDSS
jgi:broad specificity phosphatase PhoE